MRSDFEGAGCGQGGREEGVHLRRGRDYFGMSEVGQFGDLDSGREDWVGDGDLGGKRRGGRYDFGVGENLRGRGLWEHLSGVEL